MVSQGMYVTIHDDMLMEGLLPTKGMNRENRSSSRDHKDEKNIRSD